MDDIRTVAQGVRRVAVVATIAAPFAGNDLGGYSIQVELCPVVDVDGTPFIRHGRRLIQLAQPGARTQVSIHSCPWEECEDQLRLRGKMSALQMRMRLHAEYLRENGQLQIVPKRPVTPPKLPGLLLVGLGVAFAALYALSLTQTNS